MDVQAQLQYLRSRIPKPQSIESRIQDEREARQIAELAAGLSLHINPRRAEKVFGQYFSVFWETYAVHDFMGIDLATERSKGRSYKPERYLPDHYRAGLEAVLQYLDGNGPAQTLRAPMRFLFPNWANLYREAKELGDRKLLAKVRTAMEEHAAEVLDDSKRLPFGLEKDRWLKSFIKKHQDTKPKKKPYRSRSQEEWELEDRAKDLYGAGWHSNYHNLMQRIFDFEEEARCKREQGKPYSPARLRRGYLEAFEEKFCRLEEDDLKPMRKALGLLTGKKGKDLSRFNEITYQAMIGIMDWECLLVYLRLRLRSMGK